MLPFCIHSVFLCSLWGLGIDTRKQQECSYRNYIHFLMAADKFTKIELLSIEKLVYIYLHIVVGCSCKIAHIDVPGHCIQLPATITSKIKFTDY